MRRALVGLAFATGCLPPLAPPARNVIDVHYRTRVPANSTIAVYRWFGSRSGSVESRCKMIPTDSQMFALRAARCGGLRAWYWGVARLFLEEARSPRFTPALRMDGRLRWVDLPGGACGG